MPNSNHAVIVGGTKGLGRLMVQRFLDRGYHVTVLSRSAPADMSNSRLHHFTLDLETLTQADDLAEQVVTSVGPVQYLLFCQRYRGNQDAWQGEMQVSLTATQLLIKAFSSHFGSNQDNAIGIASSVYANFVGGSQPVSYHVAKAGLNQLVKYYAVTLGPHGVRINSIMPLTYLKPESRDFYMGNKELIDLYARFVPLKRLGDVEDSANLLDFLCSEKAAFINGQHIFVDGGVSVVWPEAVARDLAQV